MIRLTPRAIFYGPSPLSREPVIVVDMIVEKGADQDFARIMATLQAAHGRWYPERSQPFEASERGLIDFVLHLALAALNYTDGILTAYGATPIGDRAYRTFLAVHDPVVSRAALALVAAQCGAVVDGKADVRQMLEQMHAFWTKRAERHPSPVTEVVMAAAAARDIPHLPAWGLRQHWQFGWGASSEVLLSTGSNRDGFISAQIVRHKLLSKIVIRSLGLPAPEEVEIRSDDDIDAAVERIGYPCVVKPVDQSHGDGVSVGLQNAEQVRAAVALARTFSSQPVIVEQFVPGMDYRLMLAKGKLAGAFRRDCPAIIGDGESTVRELTDRLNQDRALPGIPSVTRHVAVMLDDAAIQHLGQQGVAPETIPAAGQTITLRGNANGSTGGSCTEVTALVHPDIRLATEALAQTLQVNSAGFDYLTTDITRSWREVPGSFIELNITPGLRVPILAGWSPQRAGDLALGLGTGRIPLDCIVVPDARLAEAEAHFARWVSDEAVGWAGEDKAQLGGLTLQAQRRPGWAGVMALLSNAMLRRAYLVVSSHQIQRLGLPVDRADQAWLCDADLPAVWTNVLGDRSVAPIWTGDWRECRDRLALEQAVKPSLRSDSPAPLQAPMRII